ncbi:MAG: 2-oxoglutarate dehydrogenase complex dihydrolipoyllysine-residue succinyltransferase [Gemmatimonadota bacterium]
MDIRIPDLAESVKEGDIGAWLKKNGDTVQKDEAILELETDKATVELAAEAAGTLEILIQAGETVHVGDVVGRIAEDGAGAAAKEEKGEEPARAEEHRKAEEPAKAEKPAEKARVEVEGEVEGEEQPAAREKKPQAEETPEPEEVEPGKEPEAEARPPREVAPSAREAPSEAEPEAEPEEPAKEKEARRDVGVGVEELTVVPGDLAEEPRIEDEPGTRRERMSRLRLRIAERLVEAQQTAAILTTFNEVDMSGVLALRQEHQEQFESQHGVRLGFMSLFARASVLALRDLPEINAFIDGNEIVYHDHVHLGIAVGTPRGLVVPVIRNVDRISLAEIERRIKELATKARGGKIAIEDLQGGTFTISNGGIYGSLMSTPILNPPQSGILGMHKIEKRPVVLEDPEGGEDRIEARPMMYVALSYDHRIVDGEGAVTFLVKLKERLEEPTRLLLDG